MSLNLDFTQSFLFHLNDDFSFSWYIFCIPANSFSALPAPPPYFYLFSLLPPNAVDLPVWSHSVMLMWCLALTFFCLLFLCHTHSTVDFPVALWLLMNASQASNEALNKLTVIIDVELLAIWTVELLISQSDEIHIFTHTHTHNHRRVRSDCDGIGQSDQSSQTGWESLERKAVVWCLISHSPRADVRRARDSAWVRVCVCVKKQDEGGKKLIQRQIVLSVQQCAPFQQALVIAPGGKREEQEELRRGALHCFRFFFSSLVSLSISPPSFSLYSGIIPRLWSVKL